MRLLAGRKNFRDFEPATRLDVRLPKSSLDGQRATVLVGPKPDESPATYRDKWPRSLRLAPGEQLDVVGVTKRLGKQAGEPNPRYPSVAAWPPRLGCKASGDEASSTSYLLRARNLPRSID